MLGSFILKVSLWSLVIVAFIAFATLSFKTFLQVRNFVIEHPKISQYEVFKSILNSSVDDKKIVFTNLPQTFAAAKDLFQDEEFLKEYAEYQKLETLGTAYFGIAFILFFFSIYAFLKISEAFEVYFE